MSHQWAAGAADPNGLWADDVVVKAKEGSKLGYFNIILGSTIVILGVMTLFSGWMAFREDQRVAKAAQYRLEMKRVSSRAAGRIDRTTLQNCVKQSTGFACLEKNVVDALEKAGLDEKDAIAVGNSFVGQLDREEMNSIIMFDGIDGLTKRLEVHVMRTQTPQTMLAEAGSGLGEE